MFTLMTQDTGSGSPASEQLMHHIRYPATTSSTPVLPAMQAQIQGQGTTRSLGPCPPGQSPLSASAHVLPSSAPNVHHAALPGAAAALSSGPGHNYIVSTQPSVLLSFLSIAAASTPATAPNIAPPRPMPSYLPTGLVQRMLAFYITHINTQMPPFTITWLRQKLAQKRVSPALTFAMLANASRSPCIHEMPVHLGPFGWHMAARAATFLHADQEPTSLAEIQAAILLDMFYIGEDMAPLAQQFRAYAYRGIRTMVLQNTADKRQPVGSDPEVETEETKRRIWWTCFMVDRFNAIRSMVPCLLGASSAQVPFPIDDVERSVPSPSSAVHPASAAKCESPLPSAAHSAMSPSEAMHPPRTINWRVRLIRVTDLTQRVVQLLKEINDYAAAVTVASANKGALLQAKLTAIEYEQAQMGSAQHGCEDYARLDAAISHLLAIPVDDKATRMLVAYRVFFRVFVHSLYRTSQILFGEARLVLLRATCQPQDNLAVMQTACLVATRLRANMAQAAAEVAMLTGRIPHDLALCIDAFQSYPVKIAACLLGDIALGHLGFDWPCCNRAAAIRLLRHLEPYAQVLQATFRVSQHRGTIVAQLLATVFASEKTAADPYQSADMLQPSPSPSLPTTLLSSALISIESAE
ncbi:hypothetical protein THASP1DRAFT_29890 [Thamnocephalis sphaerospora]|uniref:Xylanolytic transcriptional activator regulatory domain-containing protein n=1 Tax=Thamnocephalis sphaerospora TaxID=78915 RepID=A0A4V1IWP7_9FUNG|nr:hypothetical protein THASP1DRAFT_29890 [Thamnocephalis sphaerospora]|eukprot:RKP08299.1 hypothetical protein THASP1DRAFT_29890 [Thamnocephalis sphaerospora]